MKKYSWLLLVLCGFILSYKALADEVAEKTDGSFVGYNDEFSGENVQKQTDKEFVGAGTINAENTYFAGQSYQEQVGNSTVEPFAGDGTFVGNNYGK